MWHVTVDYSFSAAHYYEGFHGAVASLHGHTFGVRVCIHAKSVLGTGLAVERRDLERLVRQVAGVFEHKTLNEVEPFDKVNPTPELLAKYIYEGVEELMKPVASNGLGVEWVSVKEGEGIEAKYEEKRPPKSKPKPKP